MLFGGIRFINPEGAEKSIDDFNTGKTVFPSFSMKDIEIKQFETKPLEGFVFPDGFPNCCEGHKQIAKIGLDFFSKFPNCCIRHKHLLQTKWFNKDDYSYVPLKILNTITYTNNCITKNIEKDNWYKAITDYIEVTQKSFGQLPDGFGSPVGVDQYLFNIRKGIENEKGISIEKKEKLLKFIKHYSGNKREVKNTTDLNLLASTYRRWFKIFPFELSFFNHLRDYFANQLPILKGEPITNMYSKLVAFSLKTQTELIAFLLTLTDKILQEINGLILHENNLLRDEQKHKLELIVNARKLKLKEGYTNKSQTSDKQYIRILKSWFQDEKQFIDDLISVINNVDDQKNTSNMNVVNFNEIFLLGLSEQSYSRVEFWQRFQKESGYSSLTFIKKLNESLNHYNTKVNFFEQKNKIIGIENSNIKLPLLFETNSKLPGHFGKEELQELSKSLEEYFKVEELKSDAQNNDTTEVSDHIRTNNAYKNFEIELDEIKKRENKFWKGISMTEVIKHFLILTIKKNKMNHFFLSEKQFVAFLKRGFLHDYSQPKQKINCSNGEKGFVIKRFYEFFDLSVSQFMHPQKKKPFIDLFISCFDNWNYTSVEVYFKPNKTKENW